MAKQQLDKSNLGYLGIDFQYKLAKVFVEEPKFFEDSVQIIEQNAFTDPNLRDFVGAMKDYYNETNGLVPSYTLMDTLLRRKAKTEIDVEECTALINKLKFETSSEGEDTIKELAIRFFKQQNLIKVANKILEIAGKGEIDRYPECQHLLDEASLVGQDDDFGFNIYDMTEKALSNDYTISIPTGIDKLDETLGGGLDKGKLGLLIAPAGFGKTSFTTAIDAYAATCRCDANNHEGFKVLQIFFEDDDVDITRKIFAKKLTEELPKGKKIEARELKRLNIQDRDEIYQLLMNHPDRELLTKNLRLKHFKTGVKTATDIGIFIKRLINSGFKPDLVTIDYFECIAPEKGGYSNDSEWSREGVTMRVLENLAHEFNIAIWIPTQGTKDSMNSPDFVRMDQASGSAKKVHVAQLILSVSRQLDDIDRCRANIAILKNRSGKSGKGFKGIYFDNGTCTISCDEAIEFDSQLEWDKEMEREKEEQTMTALRGIAQRNREAQSLKSSASKPSNYVGQIDGELLKNDEF